MVCSPWIDEAALVDCGCPTDALTAAQMSEVLWAASDLLYRRSGYQWPGQCSEAVRPCRCGSCQPYPMRIGGQWVNYCGCGERYCGCDGGTALRLPRPDVTAVVAVDIDGQPFVDWRLDHAGVLVRTDGGAWPCCQVAHLPATEPGTWEVTYEYGLPIPEGGRFAARQLVVEMVKACAGDATCRLPAGVASVTRRGVQVDFAGLEGRTGLYEVDQWVNAVNPKGGKLARVLAYDDPRFIRDRIGS